MNIATHVESAILLDFLGQFHQDSAKGKRLSLGDYLKRFPGFEEGVAREYLTLVEEAERSSRAEEPEAEGEAEGEADSGGGSEVGPYRIVRPLGAGGQGNVYLAEDMRLRRMAAVKVLHAAQSLGSAARQRFQLEADLVASLDHPHVCRVLDADLEGEVPYIAMHYVPGISLADHLRRSQREEVEDEDLAPEPFPVVPRDRQGLEELLLFFELSARALHAAHLAGVIHRDIKPGNVLVVAGGEPLLLDFGLALQTEPGAERLTHSGDIFGSLAYLAPERLSGDCDGNDPRTDVYSLGVTLFECLTGEQPFQGATCGEVAVRIEEQPVPSSRAINDSLPLDLVTVCERALEKDPLHRYATALDLAEELRRVRLGEPVLARPIPWWSRAGRWVRRYPKLVASVTLVVGLLSGGLGLVLAQKNDLRKQGLVNEVTSGVFDLLTESASPSSEAGKGMGVSLVEAVLHLAGDLDQVWERFPEYEELDVARGAAHATVGKVLWSLDRRAEAFEHLEQAEDLLAGSLGVEDLTTAQNRGYLAKAYSTDNRFVEAQYYSRCAIEVLSRLLGAEHGYTLKAVHRKGDMLYREAFRTKKNAFRTKNFELFEEAIQVYEYCLEMCSRQPKGRERMASKAYCGLGLTLFHWRRNPEALAALEQGESLALASLPPDDPTTLDIQTNLVMVLGREKEFRKAHKLGTKVLAARKRIHGEVSYPVVKAHESLAFNYKLWGKWDKAREQDARAAAIEEALASQANVVPRTSD